MSSWFGSALTLALFLVASGSGWARQVCPAGYPATTADAQFADVGGGTVLHSPTGLVWKRCAEGQSWDGRSCRGTALLMRWGEALERPELVNGRQSGWNAGRTDWRLPTQQELRSIVEYACVYPSINVAQFPRTASANFWSQTPHAGNARSAWFVGFDRGYDDWANVQAMAQVRLVRGGVPSAVGVASTRAVPERRLAKPGRRSYYFDRPDWESNWLADGEG